MADGQLALAQVEVRPDEHLVVVRLTDRLVEAAGIEAVSGHRDVANLLRFGKEAKGDAGVPRHGEAGRRVLPAPFDVAEVERRVAEDRSAERATELLVVKLRDR